MRRIYLGLVAGAAAVAVLAIVSAQSFQPHAAQTVRLDAGQSGCIAHVSQFNCTMLLSSTRGPMKASQVSAVRINDTAALTHFKVLPDGSLLVDADITITSISGGALNDISNVSPISRGMVVVSFSDGTTLSATLEAQFVE